MVFPLKFRPKLNRTLRQHQSHCVTYHIITFFKKKLYFFKKKKELKFLATPTAGWGWPATPRRFWGWPKPPLEGVIKEAEGGELGESRYEQRERAGVASQVENELGDPAQVDGADEAASEVGEARKGTWVGVEVPGG
jgi:hypothetical protein